MVGKPYQLTELLHTLKSVTAGVAQVIGTPIRKAGQIAEMASNKASRAAHGTVPAADPGPGTHRDLADTTGSPQPRPTVRELKSRSYELIEELAARLHEKWRAERLSEKDGADRPPRTVVHDLEWIAEHDTDQVYLVRTAYRDLPFDFRRENYLSAKVAIGLVLDEYLARRGPGTPGFLEAASERVHIAWLERNHERAPADQKLPYALLTEEEKQKDRVVVLAALRLVDERLAGGPA